MDVLRYLATMHDAGLIRRYERREDTYVLYLHEGGILRMDRDDAVLFARGVMFGAKRATDLNEDQKRAIANFPDTLS